MNYSFANIVWCQKIKPDDFWKEFCEFFKISGEYRDLSCDYPNLVDFSKGSKNFEEFNIILNNSISIYKTEQNYRGVIASLIEFGSPGSKLIISEDLSCPQIPMILRSIRALGFDCNVQRDSFHNRVYIKLNRGVSDCSVWGQDYDPYVEELSDDDAINKINLAIVNKKPFSLVRIGHCEIRFVAQDIFYGPNDIEKSSMIQWGENIDSGKINWVRDNIKDAVLNADVLGLKKRSKFSSEVLKILDNSVYSGLSQLSLLHPGHSCVNPNIHYKIGVNFEFLDSLNSAKAIVLITPRKELKKIFEDIYNCIPIYLISLDGEFRLDKKTNIEERFKRFMDIEKNIGFIAEPGTVFLIGAGVAGKQYCTLAKKHGGIGIDMGSMMDAWAGIDSRGSGFDELLKNSLNSYKKLINNK